MKYTNTNRLFRETTKSARRTNVSRRRVSFPHTSIAGYRYGKTAGIAVENWSDAGASRRLRSLSRGKVFPDQIHGEAHLDYALRLRQKLDTSRTRARSPGTKFSALLKSYLDILNPESARSYARSGPNLNRQNWT